MRRNAWRACVAAVCLVAAAAPAWAQAPADDSQKALQGPWLLAGDDPARFAVLLIRGVASDAVDAMQNGTPVQVQLAGDAKERKLSWVTPAGIKVEARQVSDTLFEGSATDASGPRPIRLRHMQAKPAAAVPEGCAKFQGGWKARWPISGDTRLWVLGVDEACNAYMSYESGDSPAVPARFRYAKIKDETLAVGCGGGGTCTFKLFGARIGGQYVGPAGGNNAMFTRLDN